MEGDERAPAGVFRLRSVLGKGGVPQTQMPRHSSAAGDVCVDDVTSAAYNRLRFAPLREGDKAWNSAEPLLRRDALYDLVVVVDHNFVAVDGLPDASRAPLKGRGSCVFLHVWRRPKSPTVGCTAMTHEALTDVVLWLDPAKQPLLVQLPRDIYARVREPWALP
jgi:L,D-peptidoglycan transpeptidase YkuD (ErfK/YbiS/YcfS/YnhG family)